MNSISAPDYDEFDFAPDYRESRHLARWALPLDTQVFVQLLLIQCNQLMALPFAGRGKCTLRYFQPRVFAFQKF